MMRLFPDFIEKGLLHKSLFQVVTYLVYLVATTKKNSSRESAGTTLTRNPRGCTFASLISRIRRCLFAQNRNQYVNEEMEDSQLVYLGLKPPLLYIS